MPGNKYFHNMRKRGISYRKRLEQEERSVTENPLYSEGQSLAYKFWAVADRLSSSDILVDIVPEEKDLDLFLETFRRAGITDIVLTGDAAKHTDTLISHDCRIDGEAKVFRRETQLYPGDLEIVKGIRVLI